MYQNRFLKVTADIYEPILYSSPEIIFVLTQIYTISNCHLMRHIPRPVSPQSLQCFLQNLEPGILEGAGGDHSF